jgi:NADH:ubiquinone oxidoreductase subunit 2 (subunit N)
LIISAHGIFTACLFKVLIGYSSLFSLAWILSRETIIVIYFYLLLYFLNLFILCSILEFSSRDSLVELQKEKFFFKKLVVILRLLRIAGVPPLVGFLGKIYIIWELLLRLNLVLLFGLVIFSLIVLFLYLRFVTFILTFSHVYSIFSSDFFFKTEFIVFSLLLLPLVILLLGVWHKKNLIF